MATEPPTIKFSMMHRFVTDGNREQFENVYNEYLERMRTYFVAYMLTEDEAYITPLSDILWNICDFESWSIPAHVSEQLPISERRRNLDLCSTIAGMELSELLYFMGDKLPELVARRLRAEIRYRIIDSYKDATPQRYWWLKCTNNWSAVCIAAVLGTYIFAAEKHEIDAQLPRMIDSANCYLEGFEDDGCCIEGYGYWLYGFSYFCIFASLLRDYTEGKIDYFQNSKVKKIARFQQIIPLNEKECITFSDATPEFEHMPWLSHFLKGIYPDLCIPASPPSEHNARMIRNILWQNPDFEMSSLDATAPMSYEFSDAQWFIYRTGAYSFTTKAGYNGEPHNHNDVGSFIFSKGRVTFTDPGVGQYTRQYFSDKRYELMLTSSRGHSVPIINGKYQVQNKKEDISVIIEKTESSYAFTMEKAYDDKTLVSLTRAFSCGPSAVTLTDTYSFTKAPDSLTERFVSLLPITECKEGIACGESILAYDKSIFTLTFGSEEVERKKGKTGTVYYADLTLKNPSESIKLEFVIR